MREGTSTVHHNSFNLDALNWLVAPAPLVWPIWPWFDAIWRHAPTPTALYMGISGAFMLFQMCDKMGWLDRAKRRKGDMSLPDSPPEKD